MAQNPQLPPARIVASVELAPSLKSDEPSEFANDPCGDPRMESSAWSPVGGKLDKVIDGETIIILLARRQRLLVHLVGVRAPARNHPFGLQAQQFLETKLLAKGIEVWVSPSNWVFKKTRPKEVTGVVRSSNEDVCLSLIVAGLARYEPPAPYSMPGYTRCQYERAEEKAQVARLGLWGGTE
jgi:endonuclease YncB( thermonuclease family)